MFHNYVNFDFPWHSQFLGGEDKVYVRVGATFKCLNVGINLSKKWYTCIGQIVLVLGYFPKK